MAEMNDAKATEASPRGSFFKSLEDFVARAAWVDAKAREEVDGYQFQWRHEELEKAADDVVKSAIKASGADIKGFDFPSYLKESFYLPGEGSRPYATIPPWPVLPPWNRIFSELVKNGALSESGEWGGEEMAALIVNDHGEIIRAALDFPDLIESVLLLDPDQSLRANGLDHLAHEAVRKMVHHLNAPDARPKWKAIQGKIVTSLMESGSGEMHALASLRQQDFDGFEQAIKGGLNLSSLSQEKVNDLFCGLAHAPSAEMEDISRKNHYVSYAKMPAASKKEIKKARMDFCVKVTDAWCFAIKAGIKTVDASVAVKDGPRWEQAKSPALWSLLEIEGRRGGAMSGEALLLWGEAQKNQRDAPAGSMGYKAPMDWAFIHGMDPKAWSEALLSKVLRAWYPPADAMDLLRSLAKGGVDFSTQKKQSSGAACRHHGRPLAMDVLAAVEAVGPAGYAMCSKLGVDFFQAEPMWSRGASRGSVQELFDKGGARLAENLTDLLAHADTVKKDGSRELLAMRAEDGSGPLHWAARSLDPAAIELMIKHGQKLDDRDAKGATAGHWAARKYGAKSQSKVGPALSVLTKHGFKWDELDNKGLSAVAALAAKGPLGEIAELLRADLSVGEAGVGTNAMQALAKRGGDALSVVEMVLLDGVAGQEGAAHVASKKKPRL